MRPNFRYCVRERERVHLARLTDRQIHWIVKYLSQPREMDCGNHLCEQPCHKGECLSCPLLPAHVTTCPCGATPLSELLPEGTTRISCLDPVPTCANTCGKPLPCSTDGERQIRTLPLIIVYRLMPAMLQEGNCLHLSEKYRKAEQYTL